MQSYKLSTGTATKQHNTIFPGLNFLNPDIAVSTANQVIIIWAITALATASVITGIGMGIRRLSEICFSLGMVIMMMVLFLDDTWYESYTFYGVFIRNYDRFRSIFQVLVS